MRIDSVGGFLVENSATFESVLSLNESVCHPVISYSLGVSKRTLTYP